MRLLLILALLVLCTLALYTHDAVATELDDTALNTIDQYLTDTPTPTTLLTLTQKPKSGKNKKSTTQTKSSSSAAAEAEEAEEPSAPPPKVRPAGTVQPGGKFQAVRPPNMRQSAKDGSRLAPYDPFGINRSHQKKLAARRAARQEKVDEQTEKDNFRAYLKRAKKRLENERREQEENEKEDAKEKEWKEKAAKAKAAAAASAGLVEMTSSSTLSTEAQIRQEALADAEAEFRDEMEAEADANESAEDMIEMELDLHQEHEAEAESEMEAENDAEAETDEGMENESADSLINKLQKEVGDVTSDHRALMESNSIVPVMHTSSKPRLRPSSHVTYNREDLVAERFDNADSRAVFARRARGKEITRFQKSVSSSGGQAVVAGVSKLPCGKEITDQGLFGAKVEASPGPTVEAANPSPPIREDQNVGVIQALPIVPQFHEKKTLDEYGDM